MRKAERAFNQQQPPPAGKCGAGAMPDKSKEIENENRPSGAALSLQLPKGHFGYKAGPRLVWENCNRPFRRAGVCRTPGFTPAIETHTQMKKMEDLKLGERCDGGVPQGSLRWGVSNGCDQNALYTSMKFQR